MVAVIKTGHSIHRIFNYNENKVKEGAAECIGAGNYPADVDKMNLHIKLNRLLKQAELNENVTRNSVHISLNFDASDSGLSKERLVEIAETYMQKIGFGKQPYLVYQHYDAGHPHIHLVSIKVREDGSRIDTQNIGRNQSEAARKEIEKSFGLVAADGRKRKQAFELKPVDVRKVQYGRTETKRAITNVLDAVLSTYKYTSLPELNAVLKQYNIAAERGSENSRVYINRGLVYRVLDEQGNPIGVPIKASDFYSRPTLKFLEEKFPDNERKRLPHKVRVKNAIDMGLLPKKLSLQELVKVLEKQGIHTVLRQNESGLIYGITYVDHQTKCVFNGSALGKAYSAKAVQDRCNQKAGADQKTTAIQQVLPESQDAKMQMQLPDSKLRSESAAHFPDIGKAMDILMQPEHVPEYLPYHLKKKNRKKKRKRISNNP